MLTQHRPQLAPEMLAVREAVRGLRFYDHFRTDSDAPSRSAQIGRFSPVLHHDGSDLAGSFRGFQRFGQTKLSP